MGRKDRGDSECPEAGGSGSVVCICLQCTHETIRAALKTCQSSRRDLHSHPLSDQPSQALLGAGIVVGQE